MWEFTHKYDSSLSLTLACGTGFKMGADHFRNSCIIMSYKGEIDNIVVTCKGHSGKLLSLRNGAWRHYLPYSLLYFFFF